MAEARPTPGQRRSVARRAADACEYCRSQGRFSPDPFSVEHVVPRSRGGSDHMDNLAWSCQGCNNRKHVEVDGRDPVSGETVPLFSPRTQRWADHFGWNAECSLVLGLTPAGRATVERLALNPAGVVNLRVVLRRAGLHPLPEPG
jgi:hypothetical protein